MAASMKSSAVIRASASNVQYLKRKGKRTSICVGPHRPNRGTPRPPAQAELSPVMLDEQGDENDDARRLPHEQPPRPPPRAGGGFDDVGEAEHDQRRRQDQAPP